ncbi:MAG: VCBS repeat-containing protein, partial [Verrucomicrobia bacterium]|nr:VCBS repeat-containing protein [Verrucomicrobiota bacterium]
MSANPSNGGRTILLVLLMHLLPAGCVQGALAWQAGEGFRAAQVNVEGKKAGFSRLAFSATGIGFTNHLADDRSLANRNLLSGSGVAAGDADGDGLCDLYFCGLDSDNVLYRNLGNLKFEDITVTAGVACAGDDSTAAAFADIDGDSDLDLLVNSLGGGTRVFQNDGKGRFKEITTPTGVASKAGSMSMALADIDGDGDLDLYVANFRPTTIQDQITTRFTVKPAGDRLVVTHVNGQTATSLEFTNRFVVTPAGNVLELGEADFLFLNDGQGKFTAASFTSGAFLDEQGRPLREPPRDWGLAVQFHDINGDGAPDIYVCNDLYTPDRIWMNDGRGRFRALDNLSLRDTSTFSMGVDFADIDRDGSVDFFVVDMLSRDHVNRHVQISQSRSTRGAPGLSDLRLQQLRNTLLINRGDTTFAEISFYSGVEASEWSWGPIFLDVDLDGFEDILVTNGQLRDFQNADLASKYE